MNCDRRQFLKKSSAGLAAILLASAAPSWAKPKTKKPNIILVLTDDQGWTDTSVRMMPDRHDTKSDFYQTPALEQMAKEGMVFSDAYSPAPVCTPTRESIQWGKTPARLKSTGHYRLARKNFDGEISIPQAIKAVDPTYATAHFGKWGGQQPYPENAGYDRTDGNTNNYHGDWRSLKDKRPVPLDDPKQIFSLTKRANKFIEDQVKAKRPFYLQLSHYALHAQHRALKETIEKYRKLPPGKKCTPADYASPPPAVNDWALEYAAMTENLDTGLGQLLDKIDQLGIKDNTYIIFTSDNGGDFRGNHPLRSTKSHVWEGGIRVPMVVRGPGIKPGSYCCVPIAGWDFLPTFVDLAGGSKTDLPKNLDGGSLRPLFENAGKGKVHRPVEGLVFHFPDFQGDSMSAIRIGDYKLLKDWETYDIHLYNLKDDLSETNDLAAKMPDKAKQMHKKLTGYLETVNAEKAEDIHLDSIEQAKEAKRRVEMEIRKLLNSPETPGVDRWSRLNMTRGFHQDRIKRMQQRLDKIHEIKRKKGL